ncbi:MAG: hypothetical protein LQ346_007874 [Caloplaca aetnensis]|nr:MAG: hypothetical protein LQ346_007874 [Caloplaca aetnensis]
MWSRRGILAGAFLGLLAVINAEEVLVGQANLEEFQKLLDQADQASLHAALHDYSPKKFKHGMFKEDRTAVEAIHRDQPSLASTIVAIAKRQDTPSNGTATASPPDVNSPTTPPVESPTDGGESPTATPSVAEPTPIGPGGGSVIETPGNPTTPTTTVDGPPNDSPETVTSTSISANVPVGGGSSPTTSVGGGNEPSAPTTTPAPDSGPSPIAGDIITTTNAEGITLVSTVGGGALTAGELITTTNADGITQVSTAGVGAPTAGQVITTTNADGITLISTFGGEALTAGQVITTTNADGVTIVSTVGGGYVTLSSSSGGRPTPTSTTANSRTTRRPSSTSTLLRTSTLPNGSQSTVTAVTVVPGEIEGGSTPTGEAGAGAAVSGTQGASPSLQNGVARQTGSRGGELVCLLGAAIGVAMMM